MACTLALDRRIGVHALPGRIVLRLNRCVWSESVEESEGAAHIGSGYVAIWPHAMPSPGAEPLVRGQRQQVQGLESEFDIASASQGAARHGRVRIMPSTGALTLVDDTWLTWMAVCWSGRRILGFCVRRVPCWIVLRGVR